LTEEAPKSGLSAEEWEEMKKKTIEDLTGIGDD
jgi:hypothetical protein